MANEMEKKLHESLGMTMDLMELAVSAQYGESTDFEEMRKLIWDIHKEHLELLMMVRENEIRRNIATIEIPSFMNNKRGA